MTKQDSKRVRARRAALTAALTALGVFTACDIGLTDSPAGLPLRAEQLTVLAREWSTGFDQRRRLVIEDESAWREAWSRLYRNVSDEPDLPDIDFTLQRIVLATMGQRPSGGYHIDVTQVVRRDDDLVVVVVEISPGENCVTAAVLSTPAIAIAVPRLPGEIRFEERKDTAPCG